MNMNKNFKEFINKKVNVVIINPYYTYKGVLIGNDDSFLYLDTGDYEGIVAIQMLNINRVYLNKVRV